MKKTILTILTTIFGMFGGQKNKAVRRLGIPFISILSGGKKAFPLVLLAGLLMIGYGENSLLMNWLGNDSLVRLTYALLLSLPFLFYGFKRWVVAELLLILAFQVRAGSLGHIGGFDILIEDIFRYGTLGGLISWNILKTS